MLFVMLLFYFPFVFVFFFNYVRMDVCVYVWSVFVECFLFSIITICIIIIMQYFE